jgi:hypothetical protein
LLTSAVDAVVDVGASLVTYFGVRYADRPPIVSIALAMKKVKQSPLLPKQCSWLAPSRDVANGRSSLFRVRKWNGALASTPVVPEGTSVVSVLVKG